MTKKRIAVILGTRPEYLKLAPVIAELRKFPEHIETEVILTGQHRELLNGLSELFELRDYTELLVENDKPDLSNLTASLVKALDSAFLKQSYDVVVVQGDTTTAFSAALTAFYHRIPVAHVEAGLRTGRRSEPFPEELNRLLVSRLADWHFAPTLSAQENLMAEGISSSVIEVTGNTIIDTLFGVLGTRIPTRYEDGLLMQEAPELAAALNQYRNSNGKTLSLLTVHRRENQGQCLDDFFRIIRSLSGSYPDHHFIYPYHLNPQVREKAIQFLSDVPNIHLMSPLSYRPFLYLMSQVDFAMSDSGGLQEEFPSFRKPLLVLRDVTERPEVVLAGLAKLVGLDAVTVFRATSELIDAALTGTKPNWYTASPNPFGDGTASKKIVARILRDNGIELTPVREFR